MRVASKSCLILVKMRRYLSTPSPLSKNFQLSCYGWNNSSIVRKQILDFKFRGKKLAVKNWFADYSNPNYPEIKPAKDFAKSLEDKEIDAVFLGESTNADLVKKCIDAGKNVLMDGFIHKDFSASDAREIINMAKKSDKVVMFPTFKRYSPHYVDAFENWTKESTKALTENVAIVLRNDTKDIVENSTEFGKKYLFNDLDFLVQCFKPGEFKIKSVAESQRGVEFDFETLKSVQGRLEYHVQSPVFLYKFLWNNRCVVRVEGLTYYNNSMADYFAEGFIKEFHHFAHLMDNAEARNTHLENDLQTVPHVLELLEEIANFSNKTVLQEVENLSLEDKLRQLPSLRNVGVGEHLDKVI